MKSAQPSGASLEWGQPEAFHMQYKIPLVLTPQPEGGYTVTSPLLPELIRV